MRPLPPIARKDTALHFRLEYHILGAAWLACLVGCPSPDDPSSPRFVSGTKPLPAYPPGKPTAPVHITAAPLQAGTPGNALTLTVTIQTEVATPGLSVVVYSSDGLRLDGGAGTIRWGATASGQSRKHAVTMTPLRSGRFYVYVRATLEGLHGRNQRVVAFPVAAHERPFFTPDTHPAP